MTQSLLILREYPGYPTPESGGEALAVESLWRVRTAVEEVVRRAVENQI